MSTEHPTSGPLPEHDDGAVDQDPEGLIGADEHPPIPAEGDTRSRRRLLASPVWNNIPRSVLTGHGMEATWLGSQYPEPCGLYAYSRGYCMTGCKHPGMDISMPEGSELRAIAGGNVYRIRNPGISGSIEVRVRTANGHEHLYNHMSRSVVAEGTNVTKGQLLGYSGVANSPHLHFELRVPNAACPQRTAIIDPESLLRDDGGEQPGQGFSAGDRIRVDTDSLRLRSQPTTGSDIVRSLAAGTELCVVGGPQDADGHRWVRARTSDGAVGWVASQYCSLVEAGACGFETGDRIAVTQASTRLRSGPGLSASIVESMPAGRELCVTGASRAADDYDWYPVDTETGGSGWVAGSLCELAEAGGCGEAEPDPDPDGAAAFTPTGPDFAGGNLDSAAHLLNSTAVRSRVPANFLAAIIAHESTGNWARDGSRFSNIRPQSGRLLPYIGVFENTAKSRTGMTSAQFGALLGNQAGQIGLLGAVLRSQYDQLKGRDASHNWLNVASYHFSGNPVPTGWCDELGNCDDRYYNNIRAWWGVLEPGYDPDGAPLQRQGASAGRRAAAAVERTGGTSTREDATPPTPDDAHEDPAFERMLDTAYQEAQERGAFAEPDPASRPRATYVDESDRLYVGRELTIEEFASWFAVQKLGSTPFNAIGYHHTWKPTAGSWAGIDTLTGIYNFYYNDRGWRPWGKGPHLWVYSGEGDYRPGTARVYVGTHPAYDGYGIAYSEQTVRNGRWCHVEHIWDGDANDFSEALMEVSGKLLGILCARHPHADRQIPLTFIRDGGVNNPSQPLGIMYHRDENPSWTPGAWPKSCPGLQISHDRLDPIVLKHAGAEPCTASPPPDYDGTDKSVDGVVFHADRRTVESAVDGLRCRQSADTSSCQVRESLRQGERFEALYWVDGEEVEGEKRWWVSVEGFRVWMGGTVERASG